MNSNALSGLTVLDISHNLPGPYCAYLLQQMGATVIKVESEIKVDPAKFLPEFYEKLNGKKKVITLDLKTDNDLASFYSLVQDADIIIEGSRPGVAKKLKVDFDTLSTYKSDLIYCSISGYGQDSPKKSTPAHDLNLQAESGLLSSFGKPQHSICVIPIADLTASHHAYSEILAALYARRAEGNNAVFIDISMGDAMADMVDVWKATIPDPDYVNAQLDKSTITRLLPKVNPIRRWILSRVVKEPLSSLPHYGVFKCKDNRWIALGIVDEQHFWQVLCREFGGIFNKLSNLSVQQRMVFSPILLFLIKRKFASDNSEYWLTNLREIPISSL